MASSGAWFAALSATAAKPVMNMIFISGSISAARRAKLNAVHDRHDDVGQQEIEFPKLKFGQGFVALAPRR